MCLFQNYLKRGKKTQPKLGNLNTDCLSTYAKFSKNNLNFAILT